MKKTVGLMTMHRVDNCGSVLQTYATIKSIQRLDYSCTLIDYIYPDWIHLKKSVGYENQQDSVKGFKTAIKRLLKKFHLFAFLKKIKYDLLCFKYQNKIWSSTHENDYILFREKNLKPYYSKKYYKRKDILKNPPLFDIYVTGSDQTWNPRYLADDYSFLLDFAPAGKQKIAFSASFGASQVLPQYKEPYRKLLAQYEAISVRESSGIELVRQLAGKKAEWVLDPTLLLNKPEWRELADYTRVPEHKFIFCYMMDYVFDPFPILFQLLPNINNVLKHQIYIWCEKAHYEEVLAHGYHVMDKMRPEEFLGMYDKASYIVTSSFHGTAFAINFQKDFTVILNPNATKDSRVAEVLNNFGLRTRGIKDAAEFGNSPENLKTDFTEAKHELERMRLKSMTFLQNALKGGAEA